jgi:hypothetical protein
MRTSRQELLDECLHCESVQGRDIQHSLAQTGAETLDDTELSPSGRPLACCKIRVIGAIGHDEAAPAPSRRV